MIMRARSFRLALIHIKVLKFCTVSPVEPSDALYKITQLSLRLLLARYLGEGQRYHKIARAEVVVKQPSEMAL